MECLRISEAEAGEGDEFEKMNNNIKFLPLWKNTIKNRGFYESIFPFLYSILSWFILGLPTEIKSFFVISLVFVISYIFTCFLFVLKVLHKKLYYSALIIAVALLLVPFLSRLNLLNIGYSALIVVTSSFLLLHRFFYSTYNRILPKERKTKIQQWLLFTGRKIWSSISNLKLSPWHLLFINFLVLIVLLMLDSLRFLNFSTQNDTLNDTFIQINVIVFTLILSLSLAIVTSNEYSRIVKYYIELYQGWNLLFFLAYLVIIIVSMLYTNNIVYILSIFMIMNSFVFIVNLAGQTSTEKIINRLVGKLENEINKGHYSFITTIKTSVNLRNNNGFNVTTSVIDKHKEFEYNIDLLEQLAIKAFQNRDRDTFKRIIRGYLNIGRFFIMKCKDTDKNKISNFLAQILFLSRQAKQDDEFLNIIIKELIYDYTPPIPDIPIWNSQRFKLMVSIAEDNKKSKDRFNYIISILIKMLISKRGLQFENTEEYNELENIVKTNQENIDKFQIKNNLSRDKFGDVMKKQSFEEAKEKILKALDLDI